MALLAFAVASAQAPLAADDTASAETPQKPLCEKQPAFADFDFWVGQWQVYSNDAKRRFEGSNRVTKHHQGCLIMENWTSARGNTGSSMNYYDPVTGQWRQLWVASAYSIDYSGGLDRHGSMRLVGEIHYYDSGKRFPFRGTWTPNADGSVRQFFEQYDPEKGAWNTWFDGLYVHSGK